MKIKIYDEEYEIKETSKEFLDNLSEQVRLIDLPRDYSYHEVKKYGEIVKQEMLLDELIRLTEMNRKDSFGVLMDLGNRITELKKILRKEE